MVNLRRGNPFCFLELLVALGRSKLFVLQQSSGPYLQAFMPLSALQIHLLTSIPGPFFLLVSPETLMSDVNP